MAKVTARISINVKDKSKIGGAVFLILSTVYDVGHVPGFISPLAFSTRHTNVKLYPISRATLFVVFKRGIIITCTTAAISYQHDTPCAFS